MSGDEPNKSDLSDRRGRTTLVDVAEAAGVSRATVSLVLRNSPTIPERTRRRVFDAVARIGYVYNRRAAGLRSAQSNIVGVVVNDLTNPYFAEIVASIQDAMSAQGRVVVLSNCAESTDRQREFVDTMHEYNVDGIVISPAADSDASLIETIHSWGMPCILFSRNLPAIETDYVGADNRAGMREAARYLVALGHRRIAMIGLDERISTGRERRQGYLDALEEASIAADEALMIACPATRADGMAAILHLLDVDPPPTAAVCFNDIIGFGVMLGLRARSLEPGRDFSVTGFDDIAEAALWRPALTSVAISRAEIGEQVSALLLGRLAAPDAPRRQVLIEPRLIMRDTTCPSP